MRLQTQVFLQYTPFNWITLRLYTTCCTTYPLCILSTECTCVFGMIVAIKGDCFPKVHRRLIVIVEREYFLCGQRK